MQKLILKKHIAITVVAVVLLGVAWFVGNAPNESGGIVQQQEENVVVSESGDSAFQDVSAPRGTAEESSDNSTVNSTRDISDTFQIAEESENPIIFIHTEWAYDPRDINVMISEKTNLFIGKIIERAENYHIGDLSYPVFNVQVISNIKGDTSGQIRLIQGGIHYRGKYTFVQNGDIAWPKNIKEEDILFQEGAIYMIAASYSPEKGTYGAGVPPYDRELITTNSALSDAEVISLAKQNPRVQEITQVARELGMLNEGWE